MNRRSKWWIHLMGCYVKGMKARLAGQPLDACPYRRGYLGSGSSRPGGNVQRQRQEQWQDGWKEQDRRIEKGETT